MRKELEKGALTWTAVTDGQKVDYVYVTKGRRKFRLTPKDGVTDKEFNKA